MNELLEGFLSVLPLSIFAFFVGWMFRYQDERITKLERDASIRRKRGNAHIINEEEE